MKYFLVINCFFVYISAQCNDQCSKKYSTLMVKEKDHFTHILEDIYTKYVNNYEILESLEHKLNAFIITVDNALHKTRETMKWFRRFEKHNLANEFKKIMDEEKSLSSISIPKKINETAHVVVDKNFSSLDELNTIERKLYKWNDFLKNLKQNTTNIPHSTSQNLFFLEEMLKEFNDSGCYENLHEELRKLFRQLYSSHWSTRAEELQQSANKNKEESEEILHAVKELSSNEIELAHVYEIAKEILSVAEELDLLNEEIDHFVPKIDIEEISKYFEKQLERLIRKYKTDEFEKALNELEDSLQFVNKIGNIEYSEEILSDINCLTQFTQNCRVKTSTQTGMSSKCNKKIEILKLKEA